MAHTVFSKSDSLIDLRKKRVTDLKSNRRTIIPEPREESVNNIPVEIALSNMKSKIEKFASSGIEKKSKRSNLSPLEADGLKQIRKRVEAEDIYLTKSDKTDWNICSK